ADEAAEEFLDVLDDVVEVEDAGHEDLLAAEGEQLPGEGGGAVPGLEDLGDLAAGGVAVVEAGDHELGVADDDEQEVVEVVGDAAGEAADGLHLLGLAELLLEAAAGGAF